MKKSAQGRPSLDDLQVVFARPVSKTRLAEILYRSVEILNLRTQQFNWFFQRYSLNVREGVLLLKKLRILRRQRGLDFSNTNFTVQNFHDLLNLDVGLEEYSQLLKQGNLSIYDQLLQILARWRVHQWVVNNQDFIVWAHRRRDYLQALLTMHSADPLVLVGDVIEQTLPPVDFMWLVDLVAPMIINQNHTGFTTAVELTCPEYANALLRFSAQLDQMPALIKIISPLVDDSIDAVFQYVQARKAFFEELVNDQNSQTVNNFVASNPAATNIIHWLRENKGLLNRFLRLTNCNFEHKKQTKLDWFKPLIEQLLQLRSLIVQLDSKRTFDMLQFFRANQNFFTVLLLNYDSFHPAFRSYVQENTEASELVRRLQAHSERLQMLLQINDMRTVITDPVLKEYFRPLVNDLMSPVLNSRLQLLVSISGINDQWSNLDKTKVWIVTFIEKYRAGLRCLVSDKKEWRSWIKSHPEFRAIASEFRNGLIQCVEGQVESAESAFIERCTTGVGRGCVDVRPGKTVFAPIITCLLEVLGNLSEADTVNVVAKDVLLFQFVSNAANIKLLEYFYHNLQRIEPTLIAFGDHQNNQAALEVPQVQSPVLRDRANTELSVDLHGNLRLKPLKPRSLRFDFADQNQQHQVEEARLPAVVMKL